MKPYFLQRACAYLIDIVLVSLVLSMLLSFVPKSSKYEDLANKEKEIMEKYASKELTAEEYVKELSVLNYDMDKELALSRVVSIVIQLAYFGVYQYYAKGQTIGKKLMKIKIIKTNGNEISLNDSIVRCLIANEILAAIISLAILPFINANMYTYTVLPINLLDVSIILISAFMVLFRKDKRALHDLLVKTEVIYNK